MSKEKRGGARLDKNMAPKKNAPDQTQASPSQPRKLSRRARIALIVLAVVAAVLLALFVWYKNWARLPSLDDLPDVGVTADPVTGELVDQNPTDSKRKKQFYTFLVVGRDTGGGGNTDTIMFCSYDVPNQKMAVMNIPRDTLVDAPHPDKNKKINGVWNLGLYYAKKGSEKKGIDYLKETVGEMMGVTPDFYVIVNWEAFGRLVDAIDGVDFEVPFDMKYKDPLQNLFIDQAAGYRHLSGDDAMQVVRWRHNNGGSVQYADADLGRIRTQQALMKEIVKKCLKIQNATKIKQFAEIFTEEVETDLTLGNLVAFAERAIFGGLGMDDVVFTTMPLSSATDGGYVQADPEQLLGILNESLNPYVKDLEMQDLHIYRYSSSRGYYVYQGTGTGIKPSYSDPTPAQATVSKPSTTATPKPSATASPNRPSSTPEPSSASTADERPSGSSSPQPSGAPSEPVSSPVSEPSRKPEPPAQSAPAAPPSRDPMDIGIPLD